MADLFFKILRPGGFLIILKLTIRFLTSKSCTMLLKVEYIALSCYSHSNA